ncbi:MAG: DUF937 domain-containing protein [Hyphomicrobiaceae bacterium]|jgi:sporulation protein YlmC with PRC-barrel domain
MTESVLSAVARFLTPEIVGKMATASGLDRFVAQKAVDASVPAILGGLSHLASQPGGARQLGNAIAEQPAGILGSLASALGGSAQLADQGNNLLSSLLGGGVLGSIASGVSKYVGIGEGSARTLMGLLSPVIMGILGRQQRAAGLDASEFARMLAGQKDELAAAIPTGLADLLPRDLHETFDTPRSAEGRAYDFPRAAYNAPRTSNGATQRMVSEPKVESARASWPYWLLPLLALGGLLWYLLPTDRVNRQASEPTPTTTSQPASLLARQPGAETRPPYLAKASDDSISIGAFYNQDIYNRAGERLGTVKDLLIGPDGRISVAILNVGRFLGIGEKDVAVPFSVLIVDRRDGGLRISVDAVKEALQAAPAFEQMRERIRTNAPKMFAPEANPASGKGDAPGATRP